MRKKQQTSKCVKFKEKKDKEEKEEEKDWSKGRVFDLFYKRQETTRSGGGMSKKKMCRQTVSADVLDNVEAKLKEHENFTFLKYFNKLKNRSNKIAPPPRPKN